MFKIVYLRPHNEHFSPFIIYILDIVDMDVCFDCSPLLEWYTRTWVQIEHTDILSSPVTSLTWRVLSYILWNELFFLILVYLQYLIGKHRLERLLQIRMKYFVVNVGNLINYFSKVRFWHISSHFCVLQSGRF